MILQVLTEKHPKLRRVCSPADPKLAHHRTLARRLVETMKSHEALGIAANQVHPGELVRIIAVDIPEFSGAMFNPEILVKAEEICYIREGCLSTKQRVILPRAKRIIVKFTTMTGEEKHLELEELSAVVVQHEIDHLNGVLISDQA